MGAPSTASRLHHRGPLIITALFGTLVALALARHEMWLDELNPWDIARDAHSLRELFFNMRFEPHPALWYLCLYALTRVTANPVAMQALHGLIATTTAAIVAYRAPFALRYRALIVFGYYLLFEFAVISRGYALGLLFAVSACALLTRKRDAWPAAALLLALLANTSAYGLLLAASLAIAAVGWRRPDSRIRIAAAAAILIAGMAMSAETMRLHPENMFGRNLHTSFSMARTWDVLALTGAAYVPVPDFGTPAPWDTSLWLDRPGRLLHPLSALGGLALLIAAAVRVRRHPSAVAGLLVGSFAMLALIYVEYSGGFRHHGHLFVLLLLTMWLAGPLDASDANNVRAVPGWLAGVLALNVAAGLYFVAADVMLPFSSSKEVAAYVRRLPHQTPVVIAQPAFLSYVGPPLSGYLRHDVYYAVSNGVERGSYLKYDAVRRGGASEARMIAQLSHFAVDRGTDIYVITDAWESNRIGQCLARFSKHLEGDERVVRVYLLHWHEHLADAAAAHPQM